MKGAREHFCRGCGCSDGHACPGGCLWALLDIEVNTGVCSTCAERVGWDLLAMATMDGLERDGDDEPELILPGEPDFGPWSPPSDEVVS